MVNCGPSRCELVPLVRSVWHLDVNSGAVSVVVARPVMISALAVLPTLRLMLLLSLLMLQVLQLALLHLDLLLVVVVDPRAQGSTVVSPCALIHHGAADLGPASPDALSRMCAAVFLLVLGLHLDFVELLILPLQI